LIEAKCAPGRGRLALRRLARATAALRDLGQITHPRSRDQRVALRQLYRTGIRYLPDGGADAFGGESGAERREKSVDPGIVEAASNGGEHGQI
jgi:hypothetical protein